MIKGVIDNLRIQQTKRYDNGRQLRSENVTLQQNKIEGSLYHTRTNILGEEEDIADTARNV